MATENKDALMKSLNALLDETIKEFEALKKSDDGGKLQAASEHKEVNLVPEGANGSMPGISGQGETTQAAVDPTQADGKADPAKVSTAKPMGKDLDKEEDKKDDEEDKDKKKDKDEDKKDENPFVKKSDWDNGLESLRKSYDERFDALLKSVEGLKAQLEKIASQPVVSRKSLSGLQPIRKSEAEGEQPMSKTEVVGKLLEMQRAGDKRINPALITKCELASYDELPVLVKGLI